MGIVLPKLYVKMQCTNEDFSLTVCYVVNHLSKGKCSIHTKQFYYCHNKCNVVGVSLCDDLSHMVLVHVCIWICWQWNLDCIWRLLMGGDKDKNGTRNRSLIQVVDFTTIMHSLGSFFLTYLKTRDEQEHGWYKK